MHRPRALLAASFFIISLLTITATAQERALQLGVPIDRVLSGHQTVAFTVTLEENQYAQLVVEQRGIDVVVSVSSPASKLVGTFDSPNGDNGPENVSFVAITPGAYHVSVSPLDQEFVGSGEFTIKVIEVRQATDQEIKNSKNLELVKTKGIALLSEIDELIPEIHSPRTRIRAQLQAAQLLWDADEKRSAKYLNDATTGVKDYLANVDVGTQEYSRDHSAIMQLRFEIIQTLVRRDPDAALNFLYSTKAPDPFQNGRDQEDQERGMELFIVDQIAAKDPKRAVQLARQSLKTGYSPSLTNTVANIRSKEPELAAALASEIANKVLGEKLLKKTAAAQLTPGLLSLCSTVIPSYRSNRQAAPAEPVLPEATCHDLLQKVYDEAMSFKPPALNSYAPERDAAWSMLSALRSLGQDLDKTVPGGFAAVEKKFGELNGNSNPYQGTMQEVQTKLESGLVDNAVESIQKAPEELREQLYIQLSNALVAKGDVARAKQVINDNVSNPYQKRQALANLEQQEMYRAMSRGKVDEALRTIANMKTPRERAGVLMQIARQIGPGQKRATALNLLEQARSLLAAGPEAPDQDQMNALFELSRAFARYDSKRAFDIVDPLVDQFNNICAAARTLNGFGNDYFDDEELDLQNGSSLASMAMQMSNALGTLATTNFERAKLTSDRLRLPEVRLHAYLEIAQQTIMGVR